MSEAPLLVSIRHARALGYCAKGLKDYLRRHSLDARAFFRDGIPAEQIVATGDAMAIKMVEVARGQQGR